jgi:hypothetical protein
VINLCNRVWAALGPVDVQKISFPRHASKNTSEHYQLPPSNKLSQTAAPPAPCTDHFLSAPDRRSGQTFVQRINGPHGSDHSCHWIIR